MVNAALDLPYWTRPHPAPRKSLPAAVDIVVIGGGITGASLLHHLRGRARVVLLESEHLAFGASGRNAGFLLEGTSANYAAAVAAHGADRAAEIWAFTQETHLTLAEVIDGRTPYRRSGSWTLAASAEEALALEHSADLMNAAGFRATFTEQLPTPLEGFAAGLRNEHDGELDPAAAVGLLATAGEVYESCAVTALQGGDGEVIVETAGGEVRAGIVVLATNAYTPQLVPGVPIRPVRAQILATEPEAAIIAERPAYADWGYQYWRQLENGRVLCGGYRDRALDEEVGFNLETNATIQRHLDAHLRMLGVTAPVSHRWTGIMGFTEDSIPLVGRLADHPGLAICAGYTGHGLAFAFHAAQRLAAHLLGGLPPPKWMDPARFRS